MAKLPIIKYPNNILWNKSEEVEYFSDSIHALVKNLIDTMRENNGIGIASIQVGIPKRIIIVTDSVNKEIISLINPVVISKSGNCNNAEMCLSVPDVCVNVSRSKKIVVRGVILREPYMRTIEAEGELSYILQHEIDHINGVLLTNHLSALKRELYRRKQNKS